MSIIDKLLETDVKKLERKAKEYEVKRLSEAIGEKFIVTIKPLSSEQVHHISEVSKGNERENAILEACKIEGKKFSDKELLNKFGCISGVDVINKLLLPGEINAIYLIINEISGYSIDVVEEIKN